jgi:hypothetical protein
LFVVDSYIHTTNLLLVAIAVLVLMVTFDLFVLGDYALAYWATLPGGKLLLVVGCH